MKKGLLFWVPVGAAAVWAGSHFLPGFGHFGGFDFLSGGHGHGAAQGMMQGKAQGMMHGGQGHMMGGRGHGHGGFGFGWSTAVVGAGLVLFGAALRKRAGETTWKKWAGYGLVAAGLATVFKPILPIVAIGAGAYWLFKKKGTEPEAPVSVPYTAPVTTSQAATLDTWEQTISKEDK